MGHLISVVSNLHGLLTESPGAYVQRDTSDNIARYLFDASGDIKGQMSVEWLWAADAINFASIYTEKYKAQDVPFGGTAISQIQFDDAKVGTSEGTMLGGDHIVYNADADKTGAWKTIMSVSGKLPSFTFMVESGASIGGTGATWGFHSFSGNGSAEVVIVSTYA